MKLVFDTGALIAIERRSQRMSNVFQAAVDQRVPVMAPADVIAEWWRGRTDWRERILSAIAVEPVDTTLARAAGEALARVKSATVVDAIVMATAALRGGVVYTRDVDDLERLRIHFPAVRVLSI